MWSYPITQTPRQSSRNVVAQHVIGVKQTVYIWHIKPRMLATITTYASSPIVLENMSAWIRRRRGC